MVMEQRQFEVLKKKPIGYAPLGKFDTEAHVMRCQMRWTPLL